MTREARLGLNGPQVIEQESGIDEFDSRDRPMIWSLTGGAQRHACGLAETLRNDDAREIANAVSRAVAAPAREPARLRDIDTHLARLQAVDPARRAEAAWVRTAFASQQDENGSPA